MDEIDVNQQRCIVDCLECYSLCRQRAGEHRWLDDCAEICRVAADFMLRGSEHSARVCALCAELCEACADACRGMRGMDECARACRGCADSCRRMSAAITA